MPYDWRTLPAPVQEAARLFEEAGERAWLVGGATRDLLAGRPVKDFDFVMAGDGLRWAQRLASAFGGAFVALDEARGVGRVVVTHEGRPLWLDVARFRGEGEESTLAEDLALRDFTVNAIAMVPLTGEWVDPTGGAADLAAGVLRATGPRALAEDPLRVLRAVRLQATHGLQITPDTVAAMGAAAAALAHVAPERVREEWVRLLAPPGALARVTLLDEVGALAVLFPELTLGKGVTQSPPHSHDVFGHNLLVLEAMEQLVEPLEPFWQGARAPFAGRMAAHLQEELGHELPRWLLLKQVALLHDIGKPATRTVGKEGRIHFYNHEVVGAEMIGSLLRRLTFPARVVQHATVVVRHHMRPLHLSQRVPPSDRAVYRFFRDAGQAGPDVALHSVADQRGKAFATDRSEVLAVAERLFQAFFDESERFVRPRPLLDGNDLMALTGQRGPAIGEMLERLREHQAQGLLRTREEAERAVRGWQGQGKKRSGRR